MLPAKKPPKPSWRKTESTRPNVVVSFGEVLICILSLMYSNGAKSMLEHVFVKLNTVPMLTWGMCDVRGDVWCVGMRMLAVLSFCMT